MHSTLAGSSLLFAACMAPMPSADANVAPIPAAEAKAVLDAQAAHWNAGDLEGFVATYWDGAELTFLGANGLTRGRADLLEHYRRGYPSAESRGKLTFAVLDYQQLGSGHALLLGEYRLDRKQPDRGFFSLVLARRSGQVVILHDHTTAASNPFAEFRF